MMSPRSLSGAKTALRAPMTIRARPEWILCHSSWRSPSDKWLVGMRIALACFFAQLNQAAFGKRAQRLVVERSLAQQLRGRHWLLQFRNRLEELGLTRRALPQIVDFIGVDLRQRLDEKL